LSSQQHRGRGRTTLATLVAAALLTSGVAAAAPGAATADSVKPVKSGHPAKGGGKDKLGAADRTKLAKAEAIGAETVTAMIMAEPSSTKRLARSIEAAGGYVRMTDAKLGYVSAAVPTTKLDKVVVSDADVRAVDLDEVVKLPKDTVTTNGVATGSYSGPSATTPDSNPYMPTKDTGSTAFKAQHKTWDGRGVTIGILDSGIDLDSAPLRTTTTPGEEKVSDWFTATDPVTEGDIVGGDATWLAMVQDATGPRFPSNGALYRGSGWALPRGTFKIRTLDESKLNLPGCELCDANRDGDVTDRIGVLYEPSTHKIWVDTNDNKSFLDETPMRPYKASGQIGHIGKDKVNTAIHESIPFVVDYREHLDYTVLGLPADPYKDVTAVDIGIASGEHGSHVAGITAAHAQFGGKMDGQAPGAKLVSARACNFGTGCTAAALTDGMVKLARDGVDIINMSIGGLPAQNDGDNARSQLYNAIINILGVQIVISAGNSSNALNTIGDPSVATDVVSVGADITKETWAANYGSEVDFTESIMPFSSGGPREDGGFKPDITAPGAAISTTPMWLPGVPVAEAGYSLPVGYSMLQGTSMASPQATGSMALLLSAAKQTGVTSAKPAALRRAVYSSAVWNPTIPAYLQGRGQIDVPAAWELFKTNLEPSVITASAPVCTAVWNVLGKTTGTGIYNRCAADAGGQAPGSTKTYDVTLTRTTGESASGTYALTFKGDDGTFSVSPSSVSLPLNTPVTVSVTATPTAGGHSTTMLIDDPQTRGLDGSMMAVVAAGKSFDQPEYTVAETGVAKRNVARSYFVTVPQGAKALTVSMAGLSPNSQTRFLTFHPYGLPLDNTSTPNCYSNYPAPGTAGNGCKSDTRTYANPTPGVWEILVEARRTSPLLDNPFALTAGVVGVEVDPASQTIPSVVAGQATPLSWAVENLFGGVTATAVGGDLGSAKTATPTIADKAQQTYTVEVPAGATKLDVSIGNPSDKAADLDLFVTGPGGDKQSADGDSEEAVSYTNPAAGTYTVTVDGYSVPAGSTTYDYVDVFYGGSLGSITVDEPSTFPLAAGGTHAVTGSVTANTAPAAGRSLFGTMTVKDPAGIVLGSGSVTVSAVTP
jgi:Subtilase family/Bacterial pre-peptidase C-terminal domain